ncbi:MAG: PAS domain S-box protein [Victivallaceae bacterium]|nr:PAS domain S-box protein [Victivallaceae bacterium]
MNNSDQSREQLFKELELLRAENSEFKAVLSHRQAAGLKADKQLIANQQPLRQTKEFAETLLETANVIIVTLDTDANIILFNGFAEKFTGYQKQEVIGKNWFELFIPKDNSTVIPEIFQDVLKEMPEVSSYENHILCRDGSARLVSWANTVLKTDQGTIAGILSIGTDVIESRQLETERERSYDFLQTVIDGFPEMLMVINRDYTIALANQAVQRLTASDPISGCMKCYEVSHNRQLPCDDELHPCPLPKVIATRQAVKVEHLHYDVDGNEIIVEILATPILGDAGEVVQIIESCRDINECKQAGGAFLKNKYYLTKAKEIGKLGTWELDIQQNALIWTDETYKIFDVPLGTEMNYELFLDCIHPADRDYVAKEWRAGLNGEPYDIEHRMIIDDKVKWVREKADITFDTDGNPLTAIGFTQDITKRKQTAETLQLTQFSVDHSLDAVYWMGLDAELIYVNNVAAETLGYSKEELLTMTVYDIDIELSEERWGANWSGLKTHKSVVIHSTHRRKDQTTFPVEITANLINFGGREITCAIAKDITERKQAEEALRESEDKFKSITERIYDLIVSIDLEDNITYVSPSVMRVFGYKPEELIGRNITELVSKSEISHAKETFRITGAGRDIEEDYSDFIKKDGSLASIMLSAVPIIKHDKIIGTQAIIRDITKQQQVEMALRDSEKKCGVYFVLPRPALASLKIEYCLK